MIAVEYNRLNHYFDTMIAERSRLKTNDPKKDTSSPSKLMTLEEEIRMLRKEMELAVMKENSFTSDLVVQISCLLDVKINEYMKCKKQHKVKPC
ncbi:Spo0E family sporulation regulatory protein-aspartic acid phosphatase [Marinicrinis sediminis]|uniref:Spo0E family sporulation regulatory protein-aspartic acid phosphatase n=1 Tax=Marinicrinis sediminis TaxID=1652465 RepID=A0ABW5R982_9BACL